MHREDVVVDEDGVGESRSRVGQGLELLLVDRVEVDNADVDERCVVLRRHHSSETDLPEEISPCLSGGRYFPRVDVESLLGGNRSSPGRDGPRPVPDEQEDDDGDDDEQDDAADDSENPPRNPRKLLLRWRLPLDVELDGWPLGEVLVRIDCRDRVEPERVRPGRSGGWDVDLNHDLLCGVRGEVADRLAYDREPLWAPRVARPGQHPSLERLRARVRDHERRLSSPGGTEVHFLSGGGDCEARHCYSPPIRCGGFGSAARSRGRARPARPTERWGRSPRRRRGCPG